MVCIQLNAFCYFLMFRFTPFSACYIRAFVARMTMHFYLFIFFKRERERRRIEEKIIIFFLKLNLQENESRGNNFSVVYGTDRNPALSKVEC